MITENKKLHLYFFYCWKCFLWLFKDGFDFLSFLQNPSKPQFNHYLFEAICCAIRCVKTALVLSCFFLSLEEQSHRDSCALKRENKWWYQSDMSMQLTCLGSSLSIMIVDKLHKSILYWTDCVRSTAD